jgi:hypothetical protein
MGGSPKGMAPPPSSGDASPAKSPKAMGGAPKGSSPKSGMGDMAGHAGMGHAGMGGMERRNALIQSADCTAEDKHVAKGNQNSHLAYNSDGYYIDKAACFVVSQFKKLGGAA